MQVGTQNWGNEEDEVNNTTQLPRGSCAELMIMAERELAAFLSAVTRLYGAEESAMSAEVGLCELEAMNRLPGPASREWRAVTVSALARLASRLADTKVSAIPSSNCFGSTLVL